MLQNTRQHKQEGFKTIHERWHKDDKYQKFFVTHWLSEAQIIEHDKVALEDHSYVVTKPERIQNTKHWVLRLNQDGAPQPLNQRLDFAHSKRECKIMHDEHVKKTQQEFKPIPRDQQSRQRWGQAFEGIDEHDNRVDSRAGWRFCSSESKGKLSHSSS